MIAKKEPSAQEIFEYFDYKEGSLYWKQTTTNKLKVGSLAGTPDGSGYMTVTFKGKRFKVHRLIWVLHYDEIPANMVIDHIDRDVSNNRIENLRLVTKSQNGLNSKRKAVGVSWDKSRNKWRAQASILDRTITLGRFDDFEEAKRVYDKFTEERWR